MLGPAPVGERLRSEFELARRRGKSGARDAVDHHAGLRVVGGLLVRLVDVVLDLEHAVLPHVGERRQSFFRRRLRQSRHRVFEHPPVVLVHRHALAGTRRRFEVPAHAERAVGIDLPRERGPELAFLPDLAGIGFVRRRKMFAALLARDAQHRLAKSEPLRGVRFLTHGVVALGSETHRQDVISEPGGLAPCRRQRDVQADLVAIGQHLHP